MVEARPATTLLLLRTAASGGLEVFMVQRHRNSGFLPNAWVFPGGRVDAADALDGHPRVRGGEAIVAAWGIPRERAIAHLVAGVRETFEECGIWLGTGAPPPGERAPLAAGELTMAALLERYDATLDLDRLIPWSWWTTPTAEKRRYDTRFLAVLVDGEAVGTHDERETVASGWFHPSEAVSRDLASLPLAPPTWWTLRELADCAGLDALRDTARPVVEIQPIMEFRPEGMRLLMPGHPEHPQPAVAGLPTHVSYAGDRWVAWDGELRRS